MYGREEEEEEEEEGEEEEGGEGEGGEEEDRIELKQQTVHMAYTGQDHLKDKNVIFK